MSFAPKPSRRFLPFPAVLAMAAVMSLTVAAVLTLWSLENENAKAAFDIVAEERFDALETSVTLTLHSLVCLGALHDHAARIERGEFARFAKDLLERDKAIQALEWIPRTPKRDRQIREDSAHRDGFPSFQFSERLPQGKLVRAGDRDEYFPVFFVEPLEGNQKALGFDLASDPVRDQALRRSGATGSLVATGRVSLVQETANQYGFLVFRPVYQGGETPPGASERRELLTGYALAVFRIGDMIEKVGAADHNPSGLQVTVFDLDAKPGERILYPKTARFDGIEDVPGHTQIGPGDSGCRTPLGHGGEPHPAGISASAEQQRIGTGGRVVTDRHIGRVPSPESSPATGDRTGP